MLQKMTFRADVDGRPFGVIVVRQGMATARAARAVLRNVPLAHALLWVSRHNPRPQLEPSYELVGRFHA